MEPLGHRDFPEYVVLVELFSIHGAVPRIVAVVATGVFCSTVFAYLVYMNSSHRLAQTSNGLGTQKRLFALKGGNLDHEVRSASDHDFGAGYKIGVPRVGRMEVRVSGWVGRGPYSRLAGVSGEVFIPWSSVQRVEVGKVPGTIVRKSGGGISITLENGHRLDGQFIGAKGDLIKVLDDLHVNGEPDRNRGLIAVRRTEAWPSALRATGSVWPLGRRQDWDTSGRVRTTDTSDSCRPLTPRASPK